MPSLNIRGTVYLSRSKEFTVQWNTYHSLQQNQQFYQQYLITVQEENMSDIYIYNYNYVIIIYI